MKKIKAFICAFAALCMMFTFAACNTVKEKDAHLKGLVPVTVIGSFFNSSTNNCRSSLVIS